MKKIPLTQGKFAIVDDEDFERVSLHKWFASHNHESKVRIRWYAKTNAKPRHTHTPIRMHRFILGLTSEDKVDVDHKNGNTLDNRRSNLQIVSRKDNVRKRNIAANNTSGYKGVHRDKNKWRARIGVDGKYMSLGMFDSPSEAAKAYNVAAKKYFGDFAVINVVKLNNEKP